MLIGLTGKIQSGKDTTAEFFIKEGYTSIAYGDHLKDVVMQLFRMKHDQVYTQEGKAAIDERYGVTPRYILQWFGTEVVRDNYPDLWVDHMTDRLGRTGGHIVVTDIRFNNEAALIKKLGGTVIEIIRPVEKVSFFQKSIPQIWREWFPHRSERPINRDLVDFIVINNGTIAQLHQTVKEMTDG